MSTIRRQGRFAVVPERLIRSDLSDRAVRVWMLLDRYAGGNTIAFPSRERLCQDISASPSSLDRAVKDLCEAGWLVVERRAPGGVNNYLLTEAPLVPSDEGVSSPMTTPLVTHDDEKEASPQRTKEGAPASSRRTPDKKGKRLPADFAVTEAMEAWATDAAPLVNLLHETGKFIDYWTAASGRTATKRDWTAAWRVWMRTAQERAAATAARGGPRPDVLDAALSRLAGQ